MIKRLLSIVLLCQFPAYVHAGQGETTSRGGVMYIGIWPNRILVMDERELKVVGEIKLQTGVPEQLMISYDRSTLIAITAQRNIEVVDLLTRKTTGHFPVAEGNRQVQVMSGAISPTGRRLYLTVNSAIKEIDRFLLEKAKFHVYDLEQKKLVRTFDFPKGFDERLGFADTSYKVSQDEKRLYVFREDILIFDLETFQQIDKVEISKPQHPGQFAIEFDGEIDPNEEPDAVTSVFTATDSLARRPLAGIVKINIPAKKVDIIPLGPVMPIRGRLFLSPDRKRAYAVVVNDAQSPNRRPEFWVFDLESHKLVKRVEFENRPRFTFGVSSDARDLYIWGPGADIDVYDPDTLKLKKTITLEGDITEIVLFRPRA